MSDRIVALENALAEIERLNGVIDKLNEESRKYKRLVDYIRKDGVCHDVLDFWDVESGEEKMR